MRATQEETMPPKPESPAPVNMVVVQKDDKVTVRFDTALNFLVMEPVAAIRIGEMLKEKGIEILRQSK